MLLKVLHKNKLFIQECADILNEEWKRSNTARLFSLESSNDNYPVNLVFVDDNNVVVGHSRLSLVVGQDKCCLVESVVIKKCMRGKGLGKLLMKETEQFAKSEGFKTVYLSTHDKQDFYQHIGYSFCKPIVSCGIQSPNLPKDFLNRLAGTSLNNESQSNQENSSFPVMTTPSAPPPPPPSCPVPPPPPKIPDKTSDNNKISRWDPRAISWMKKDLV